MVVLHRGPELVDPFAATGREVVFVDVGSIEDRLGGEQAERAQELDRVAVFARFTRAAPRVQLLHDALEQHELELGFLIAGARRLARLVEPALDHGEIRQRELARDDVVVAHRIDRAHHVHDVGVFEGANHVHDGVHFADV